MEISIDSLEVMCSLMCDNAIPKRGSKNGADSQVINSSSGDVCNRIRDGEVREVDEEDDLK